MKCGSPASNRGGTIHIWAPLKGLGSSALDPTVTRSMIGKRISSPLVIGTAWTHQPKLSLKNDLDGTLNPLTMWGFRHIYIVSTWSRTFLSQQARAQSSPVGLVKVSSGPCRTGQHGTRSFSRPGTKPHPFQLMTPSWKHTSCYLTLISVTH